MAQLKRQDSSIGNGPSEIHLPEKEKDPTEGRSTLSPQNTDIDSESISSDLNALEKPGTMREALGLLQSRFFDLRGLRAKVRIEASSKGNLYVVISWPGHVLGFENGHILADGSPVLEVKEEE